jgi:hypothetical protein
LGQRGKIPPALIRENVFSLCLAEGDQCFLSASNVSLTAIHIRWVEELVGELKVRHQIVSFELVASGFEECHIAARV